MLPHLSINSLSSAVVVRFCCDLEGRRVGIDGSPISFANEGQLLVLSQASVRGLQRRLEERHCGQRARGGARENVVKVTADRFRPNLVVDGDGLQPHCEDAWREVSIGEIKLRTAGITTSGPLLLDSRDRKWPTMIVPDRFKGLGFP